MFNTYDEYEQATKEAQINQYEEEKTSYKRLIVFNALLFSIFSIFVYFGFSYFKAKEDYFQPKKVLGVSYINPKYAQNDEELIHILDEMEVDTLDSQKQLSEEMREVVAVVNGVETSYERALERELEREPLMVIVSKGDTLGSLAQKYYGDVRDFHKIIEANPALSEKSNTIHVGQKLILP
jgi:nucleoid-associated protein YgaU